MAFDWPHSELKPKAPKALNPGDTWDFPKIRAPYFGVLIIRILLFRVLYWGPLFSETPPPPPASATAAPADEVGGCHDNSGVFLWVKAE